MTLKFPQGASMGRVLNILICYAAGIMIILEISYG